MISTTFFSLENREVNKNPEDVLLEVSQLTVSFRHEIGATKAVDGVNFAVHKGETVGIVGESGSGKSVSALSIMKLIPQPPGKIESGSIKFQSPTNGLIDILAIPEEHLSFARLLAQFFLKGILFPTYFLPFGYMIESGIYRLGASIQRVAFRKKNKIQFSRGKEIAMIFQEPMTSLNPVYTCGDQVMETILKHHEFPSIPLWKEALERNIQTLTHGFNLIMGLVTPVVQALASALPALINEIFPKKPLLGLEQKIKQWLTYKRKEYLTSQEKIAKEMTLDLFRKTELPRPEDIFNSYPHQISGGQKQRVMIAIAMCSKPSMLIADEPTTALDVTVQATILNLMRQLRDENKMSILFITHDLGVIAEIADRVMVMYRGKIVEQGTTWDIFSNPQHPYTKSLLACRPRLDISLKVLPVVADFMDVDSEGNITEKANTRFHSVGEAILLNFEDDEEVAERYDKLYKQQPQLEVRNLSMDFPIKKGLFGKVKDYVKAVDDVSFNVYPGETIGLVGESGCGKTTLGRAILRLIEPTDGQIIFEGKDITHIKDEPLRKLRKDIQIIFQDPYSSLNPRMTVGEALLEPMRVNNLLESDFQRKKHCIEILERVNLSKRHFERYPHEFSGGQRQRICIARALALNPKFIICDESVSALDVSVQAQVLNLLNQLKNDFKFTYIFISHDLSVVKFMSDRILVMNKGKIEETDYAVEIYDNPKTEYTRRLISAIPRGDLEDIRRAQLQRKKISLT